ncbi:uncharacterized protein LOC116429588 [Nomia melanderi]|uniref:uncharacterized protein LOC116429588 n=1 Tax=Nomia melanderi TaxID=2448451 RepID=UPI003FCC6CBC
MVKNAIKVYARLRPEMNRKNAMNYKVHRHPDENPNEDFLILLSRTQKTKDYPDNRPESWNYSFFRVFEESASQEDVFENVARPVMESALDGYNGTIFAYGQTASGKTYSIIGDQGRREDRGIIPRCLQYLFDIIGKQPENVYTVEVAFLEIYNENGYDLLDRRQRELAVTRLEDLPRVTIQEDENGQLHLKNLGFHTVGCLEDAYELLLVGDRNRVTTETPMNPQSSRSHCIFTIVLSMKEFGADHYKRAKVHLVDLAGSERVYKCSITDTILTEAKHINLSLHYLEQVIVCLGQESVSHIPYRNSCLTSILRDSLGGNCMTAMLANLSVASWNLEETISTCRFAQRVALIKNDVKLVLETSIQSENALLKLENERLKQQIRTMAGRTQSEELTAEDKRKLDAQIRNFLESKAIICWSYNPKSIEYCFESFRRTFQLSRDPKSCLQKLKYYKDLVDQRDKEISLLINLLRKEKRKRQYILKEGSFNDLFIYLHFYRLFYYETILIFVRIKWQPTAQLTENLNSQSQLTTVSENRTMNVKDIEINVDKLISISNHILPKKHKKKCKNSKSTIQSHINHNLQSIITDESKSNFNKNFINERITSPISTALKINTRRSSFDQVSTNKHISVDNIKPQLLNCNVVNLSLDNLVSNKSKAHIHEETQQFVHKREKTQFQNSEIKSSTIKNVRLRCSPRSAAAINEGNEGNSSCHSQNIKAENSVTQSDHSIPFYQKMLSFNVPRNQIKSPSTVELCTTESIPLKITFEDQNSELNSGAQNYDLKLNNIFHANKNFSTFMHSDDTFQSIEPNSNSNSFSTRKEFKVPTIKNDNFNFSISSRSTSSHLQNIDRFVDNVTSRSFTEPLEASVICNEEKDAKTHSTRSVVYSPNSEMEDNRSKRSGRKLSVRSFTPDWPETSNFFSATTKTKECSNKKSESDTNNDSFEASLPLTGDPEIDEEIIAFYKAKRLGGVY